MEVAARLWRMHGDSAANHIKYNENDLVDCFVINFILQNNECWKVTVTKEGSTVCSEFVCYVPRTFNRTVLAYRTAIFDGNTNNSVNVSFLAKRVRN